MHYHYIMYGEKLDLFYQRLVFKSLNFQTVDVKRKSV